jgi:hypothetical protein
MHDQFVADVGDFGKYIMLNKLSEIVNGGFKIGINWYYNKRPTNTLAYLYNPEYTQLDSNLLSKLKTIIDSKRLLRIWEDSVLPKSHFVHYHDEIPYKASSPSEREENRKGWFQDSIEKLKDAQIVFLDPDNGIPYPDDPEDNDIKKPRVKLTQVDAIKYAYVGEIDDYYRQGKSVIVYQNKDRKEENELLNKLHLVKNAIGPADFLMIRFKRVQVRYYMFLSQKDHAEPIHNLVEKLTSAPFDFLFSKI